MSNTIGGLPAELPQTVEAQPAAPSDAALAAQVAGGEAAPVASNDTTATASDQLTEADVLAARTHAEELDAELESEINETTGTENVELTDRFEIEFDAFNGKAPRPKMLFVALRRARLIELVARDDAKSFRSRALGGEKEEILSDPTNNADVNLFNKTVDETRGYKLDVKPGQSAEEREAALATIPRGHKIDLINAVYEVDAELIFDEAMLASDVFTWGEQNVWKVRVDIGANADHSVILTLQEPGETQITDYSKDSSKFTIERSGKKPITEISVKLVPGVRIGKTLLKGVEGYTVNGEPFDVTNKQHLELIDPYVLRAGVDAVMKVTRLDLGNS